MGRGVSAVRAFFCSDSVLASGVFPRGTGAPALFVLLSGMTTATLILRLLHFGPATSNTSFAIALSPKVSHPSIPS